MDRRTFLNLSTGVGGSVLLGAGASPPEGGRPATIDPVEPAPQPAGQALPDLAPARWVWYPSGRTLQNTFVLFRREIRLPAPPRRATGWVAADSRYRLDVNGQRVQWGPPPADPRWAEADPVDLTTTLKAGRNVLGATVLFYGQGDGTWPIGLPGFLFRLEIEHHDGRKEVVASDASWRAHLARAWPPGHYKRWYLRALQEEFDARLYPHGWNTAEFTPTADWLPAAALPGSPNKPALSAGLDDYMLGFNGVGEGTELRPRSVPLLREESVAVRRLVESHTLTWSRPPVEYFEFRTPGAFRAEARPLPEERPHGHWQLDLDGNHGVALTFELAEQVVGWPSFTIDAPEGTTVELLVHEAHQVGGPPLLNTHFDSWSRFTCRAGSNRFETFDFESLRWLQLHVHGAKGRVTIGDVGVRRRLYPWPNEPHVKTSEAPLQRLFDASFNTLHNCAQETIVDGMARERQQYSGDGAHQLHAVHLGFGETRLPARFLTTFSQW
jgi:alpha-L-rhamnosidase